MTALLGMLNGLNGMVTLPGPSGEDRKMVDRTVVVTALICGTILILGVLGAIAWLSANGHGTEAIMTAIVVLVFPLLGGMWSKLGAVQQQTNGERTKMMEAQWAEREKLIAAAFQSTITIPGINAPAETPRASGLN